MSTNKKAVFKKMIDLDLKLFIEKIIADLVLEINSNNIYMGMVLINEDTIILFQIIVLRSKIWYLGIVVFFLVCYLVDIVIKNEYP